MLLGQVQQRPHPRIRLAGAGIEQGVQVVRLALMQHLPQQRHGQFLQVVIPPRAAHAEEAATDQVNAVYNFSQRMYLLRVVT